LDAADAEQYVAVDVQGRASNKALEPREVETRFKDHINELHKKAFSGFVDVMDEVTPTSPFPHLFAKALLWMRNLG
jgi:hypothetical protein